MLRPNTEFLLSFRLPPNLNSEDAEKAISLKLKSIQPLYNAKFEFECISKGTGYVSQELDISTKKKL